MGASTRHSTLRPARRLRFAPPPRLQAQVVERRRRLSADFTHNQTWCAPRIRPQASAVSVAPHSSSRPLEALASPRAGPCYSSGRLRGGHMLRFCGPSIHHRTAQQTSVGDRFSPDQQVVHTVGYPLIRQSPNPAPAFIRTEGSSPEPPTNGVIP